MEPSITICIKDDRDRFTSGETLGGNVSWRDGDTSKTAELSVLWYTEGKGDTDSGIVHFDEFNLDHRLQQAFEVKLPLLPLTYHGELLKIHWTIRVRIDNRWGSDPIFELPFEVRGPESVSAAHLE